jgi:hypothetical protein
MIGQTSFESECVLESVRPLLLVQLISLGAHKGGETVLQAVPAGHITMGLHPIS